MIRLGVICVPTLVPASGWPNARSGLHLFRPLRMSRIRCGPYSTFSIHVLTVPIHVSTVPELTVFWARRAPVVPFGSCPWNKLALGYPLRPFARGLLLDLFRLQLRVFSIWLFQHLVASGFHEAHIELAPSSSPFVSSA